MAKIKTRPGESKEEAKLRAQKEARAERERECAEQQALWRGINTKLLFWAFCSHKRCQRGRACLGDVDACRKCFLPQMPDWFKVSVKAMAEVYGTGGSKEDALRAADAAMARLPLEEPTPDQDDPAVQAGARRFLRLVGDRIIPLTRQQRSANDVSTSRSALRATAARLAV